MWKAIEFRSCANPNQGARLCMRAEVLRRLVAALADLRSHKTTGTRRNSDDTSVNSIE